MIEEYIAQLAPILIGLVFLMVIRLAVTKEDRLLIRSTTPGIVVDSADSPETEKPARHEIFYDSLIAGGIFPKNLSINALERTAARSLGVIDIANLSKFKKELIRSDHKKLLVHVHDVTTPLMQILSFEGNSGFLLSYLAGYRLEFEVV